MKEQKTNKAHNDVLVGLALSLRQWTDAAYQACEHIVDSEGAYLAAKHHVDMVASMTGPFLEIGLLAKQLDNDERVAEIVKDKLQEIGLPARDTTSEFEKMILGPSHYGTR